MTDIESRMLRSVGRREESRRLRVEEERYREYLSLCVSSACWLYSRGIGGSFSVRD
jgi:hypothetical protein